MSFGPTPFPRQPVRAVVINPDRQAGYGYIVGALERGPRGSAWIEQPQRAGSIMRAWVLARDLRKRTGLPVIDRTGTAEPNAPTGGMAA